MLTNIQMGWNHQLANDDSTEILRILKRKMNQQESVQIFWAYVSNGLVKNHQLDKYRVHISIYRGYNPS